MKKLLALLIVLVLSVMAFASCDAFVKNPDETPEGSGLENAEKYVSALYKEMSVTGADYELVGQVTVDGVTYTVTWKVNVTEGVTLTKNDEKNVWNVDVFEETGAPIAYELTATITDADGNKAEKTFKLTVPKFKVNTYEDYKNAEADQLLTVEGIIIGITAKSQGSVENQVYVQSEDGKGGFLAYGVEKDPLTELGLKVGMTVRVTGAKKDYNGTLELVNKPVIKVLDETIKTVAAQDWTTLFQNAESISAEELLAYQAILVTIKNVTLTTQDTTNGYYNFKLGEKEAYLRISSSNNCITKDEINTFKGNHKNGLIADITGITCIYQGKLYLIPATVDAISNIRFPELAPADEIAYEIANMKTPAYFISNGEFTLPLVGADYSDVEFEWTVTGDGITYDATTGKVTITVGEGVNKEVTISYVATSGEEATKEGTVKFAVIDPSTLANKIAAASLGASFKDVELAGVITAINTAYDVGYKNITVTVAVAGLNGTEVQLYRLKLSDAEGAFTTDLAALKIGDFVGAKGELSAHKGTVQINAGVITACETNDSTVTKIGALASGTSFVGALTGEIVSIDTAYDSYWKNVTFTIKVGELTIKVYRAKGEAADKVKVGDTVTVMGTVENGSSDKQFTEGTLIAAHTEAAKYVPSQVKTPVANTPYVLYLAQANLGKFFYANGKPDGNYFALTDSAKKAVTVYLEAVTGGFKIYFTEGEGDSAVKKYFDVYNYGSGIGVTIRENGTAVFTADANGLLSATVEGKTYAFGATGTYANLSKQELNKAGVMYAYLGTVVVEDQATAEQKIAASADLISVKDSFNANGTLTLPSAGAYAGVTITWTAEGATITDGTITITQTTAEQTITLKATISCGTATPVEKAFTVKVSAKPAYTIVDTIQVSNGTTEYGYYMLGTNSNGTIYFNGSADTDINVTTSFSDAKKIYFEAAGVEGVANSYYIYYKNADGSKTYIALTKNDTQGFKTYTSLDTLKADGWYWLLDSKGLTGRDADDSTFTPNRYICAPTSTTGNYFRGYTPGVQYNAVKFAVDAE